MDARKRRVRLVVGPGVGALRARTLATWLRVLVPAAVLVLSAPGDPADGDDGDDDVETVSVDADAVPSGPLSLADLLARAATRR